MTVTPTSQVAIAINAARVLISKSAVWQARVAAYHDDTGTAEANALRHVMAYEAYIRQSDSETEDLTPLRPFVIVGLETADYSRIYPACATAQLKIDGGVWVVISDTARFADIEGGDDWSDSYIDFCNLFFGTLEDMNGKFSSDVDPYGKFSGIELIEPPQRPERKHRSVSDFWYASASFTFSDDPAGAA